MNIQKLLNECKAIKQILLDKGLTGSNCSAYVHWLGYQTRISVEAREPYNENGSWASTRAFSGTPDEMEDMLRKAFAFAHAVPGEKERAIESMVQKLNKLAGELPTGGDEIVQKGWEQIRLMLLGKAQDLAKNGLVSPERIGDFQVLHGGYWPPIEEPEPPK